MIVAFITLPMSFGPKFQIQKLKVCLLITFGCLVAKWWEGSDWQLGFLCRFGRRRHSHRGKNDRSQSNLMDIVKQSCEVWEFNFESQNSCQIYVTFLAQLANSVPLEPLGRSCFRSYLPPSCRQMSSGSSLISHMLHRDTATAEVENVFPEEDQILFLSKVMTHTFSFCADIRPTFWLDWRGFPDHFLSIRELTRWSLHYPPFKPSRYPF